MRLLAVIVLVALFAGCGPSGQASPMRVGASAASSSPSPTAPPAFAPPLFMPYGDRVALAFGLSKYQAECEAELGWSQPPGSLAIFDTVTSAWAWAGPGAMPARWYVLRWPLGSTGRPRRLGFAPDWGAMLVQDRRYVLGISMTRPLDAREAATISRSRTLPAYLAPVGDTSIYDN